MPRPPSSERASYLHFSFSLNRLSSSFPHPCMGSKEALNCRLTLSQAVLFKGDLEASYCRPHSPFSNQHLHSEREFQLSPQRKKAKGEGCQVQKPNYLLMPLPSHPCVCSRLPPSPAGGWRSGEITWEPREAPRGTRILSLEVAPLPAGPPGLLPPSAPARVPGPSGSGAQQQPHAALCSPTWRDAGGDYLRGD